MKQKKWIVKDANGNYLRKERDERDPRIDWKPGDGFATRFHTLADLGRCLDDLDVDDDARLDVFTIEIAG